MALKGPIILVEDDKNDAEVLCTAIKELGIPNDIKILHDAQEAFDYLCTTQDKPLVILCDIRMPLIDGLTFRKNIIGSDYLRRKSIPFVFLTGAVSQDIVNEAYELDVQGFFQKAGTYTGIKDQLLSIFMYWKRCLHPNKDVAPVK